MSSGHLFIIFGATGDLTQRKLLPAFYALQARVAAGDHCVVLGVARSELDDAAFREMAVTALGNVGVPVDAATAWADTYVHYQSIREGFGALASRASALEKSDELTGNRVLYLALPPGVFESTLAELSAAGLGEGSGWTRVVVEKPFGRDLATGEALNEAVHEVFDESQVYRIDHYLGKETVRNLLVFRFANSLFEGAWNRDRVESIQITVAEHLGVEQRAGYYDTTGAVRDMLQSHLAQVMSLVGMEPPVRLTADAIRDEKVKFLQAIRPITEADVVLGQYGAGEILGASVPGYLAEDGVALDSLTPTSVACRLFVDNWRWQGVPFLLRTGKRYPERLTKIVVTFREAPISLFGSSYQGHASPNQLIITLQPDEGFQLTFDVKSPGDELSLTTLPFEFSYAEAFGRIPEAYETLLADVLEGDQTLFVRGDEVEQAWEVFEPMLRFTNIETYAAGTWGPEGADDLTNHHPWHS